VIEPRPVLYASSIPFRPTINPPVGKSGPLTCSLTALNNSSFVAFGFSKAYKIAFVTSLKLCGGIFVAIPTAIPLEPLTKRFGILAGKTVGS